MLTRSGLEALLLIGAMAACATTPKSIKQEPQNATRALAAKTPVTPPKANAKRPVSSISADAEYSAFFARMVSQENDYTEKDRQILKNIPHSPSGGTIHEAALVIGLLRDVITPIGTQSRLEVGAASDGITPGPASRVSTSRAIESRMRENGVDLIGALTHNPYLKGREVFSMVFEAANLEGNSPLFTQNLIETLRVEAKEWIDFSRRLGIPSPEPARDGALASDKANTPTSNLASTGSSSSTTPTAETFSGPTPEAAKFLAKAQELAAKDQIDQAIIEAKKVPEGTDSYSAARNNIKLWSDRATQDLRKQAAQQYRASTAVTDIKGKRVYLSKARNLLEEALNKYPESTNLDTVKENLEIINQELSHLE